MVGAYPPEVVRRLADDPAVEVTGRVDDIAAYYRRAAVFVAPVLQGSGTRLKILEAMASGCPVVSTTIGAEGLGATDGRELADRRRRRQAWPTRSSGLLRDPAPSARDGAARRAHFVEARFDWDGIAARLVETYEVGLGCLPANARRSTPERR